MLRIALLVSGCMMLLLQHYLVQVNTNTQFFIFLAGILLLGVPHGAADLLVATRNAGHSAKPFSKFRFLAVYLSRIALFALILWFFPVTGTVLFILFAAYHFGETDLYQFKTDTLTGRLFVISYGMLVLSVILMQHFEEVKPLFQMFEAGRDHTAFINWVDLHRYQIISASGLLFFVNTFTYFILNNNLHGNDKGEFLVRLGILLFILFNMPMLLGFTFYFVVWHSVLSLNNIFNYLQKENAYTKKAITRQIVQYSLLAIVGTGLFGLTGFMFVSNDAIVICLLLGLAVLTAPHMQIMHDMYCTMRMYKQVKVDAS